MTMSYNIPNHDLVLADGTVSSIDKEDWSDKTNVDENVILAARKPTFQTDHGSSSLNLPENRNLHALWKLPTINKDKPDAMTLLSDKRAYMHDPFQTMTKQLDANKDTLETLTEDIGMMKSEIISKLDEFKTMSETQRAKGNALSTLAEDVKIMKEQLISNLDELNTKADKSHDMVSDQYKNISKTIKSNSDKLDLLTKYIERLALYSSCLGYLKAGFTTSGEYMITIPYTKQILTVYCDQETDGGGWLVFQRRQDGSIDFYRDWQAYKAGFGVVNGEFWLGNDHLHSLTRDKQELRVDLMDFDENTVYAKYASFSIGLESENYILSVSGFTGTVGDSFGVHNGYKFSTKDRDNDVTSAFCALQFKGGWWYSNGYNANLNGIYYDGARSNSNGIRWNRWKYVCLKKTEMKIRPKQ